MTGSLTFKKGDATKPTELPCIIAHVTNNRGGWGRGFVLALEKEFPGTGERWKAGHHQRLMTTVSFKVADGITLANMCCQDGYRSPSRPCPLNYQALEACLNHVRFSAMNYTEKRSVHMPRIGTGLAGGDWNRIEALIQQELVKKGVHVIVYDL